MWFKQSMSIAQQLIPIYNITVHKTKSYIALNVVKLFVPKVKNTNRPQGQMFDTGIVWPQAYKIVSVCQLLKNRI